MSFQPPVIVVPGITASALRDVYPTDPETVWNILGKDFDRVALHPDDARFERMAPQLLRPDKVFDIPYAEFIRELRHNLTRRGDELTPVYPFPYDWRQPLARIEEELAAFIEEVIERTRLTRHYHREGYGNAPCVDLVGHSMGGLIITGYLAAHGGEKVRKVATLATPYQGSFEAVLKVVVGTADLGAGRSVSAERETARVTPSIYHLVPTIGGAVTAEEGLNVDLFDADAWQPGVIQTIGEYVRRFGLELAPGGSEEDREAERLQRARSLFGDLLDEARHHRDRINGFNLGDAGLSQHDWLCVIGVGGETRVALRIGTNDAGEPHFDLTSADRKNGYLTIEERRKLQEKGEEVPEYWQTGDGTVSYEGAKPGFLDLSNLVCLSADDFGYWEIGDKLLNAGAGFHGILPKMNLAHKLVVAHLKGEAGRKGRAHDGLRGRRAPELGVGAEWNPPLEGLKERLLNR